MRFEFGISDNHVTSSNNDFNHEKIKVALYFNEATFCLISFIMLSVGISKNDWLG